MSMRQLLAMLAAMFLLLRPLCDVLAAESAHAVHEAGPHAAVTGDSREGSSDGPCCADIEDGALAKVSKKAGTTAGPDPPPSFQPLRESRVSPPLVLPDSCEWHS